MVAANDYAPVGNTAVLFPVIVHSVPYWNQVRALSEHSLPLAKHPPHSCLPTLTGISQSLNVGLADVH